MFFFRHFQLEKLKTRIHLTGTFLDILWYLAESTQVFLNCVPRTASWMLRCFSSTRSVGGVGCAGPLFYCVLCGTILQFAIVTKNISTLLNMANFIFVLPYLYKVTAENAPPTWKNSRGGTNPAWTARPAKAFACWHTSWFGWFLRETKKTLDMLIANYFSSILKAGHVFFVSPKNANNQVALFS